MPLNVVPEFSLLETRNPAMTTSLEYPVPGSPESGSQPQWWTMLAQLLPTPGDIEDHRKNGRIEAVRLAWELTGTTIVEREPSYSLPGRPAFRPVHLGPKANMRYAEKVIFAVMRYAETLGWQAVYGFLLAPGTKSIIPPGQHLTIGVDSDRNPHSDAGRTGQLWLQPHQKEYVVSKRSPQ